MQKIIIMLGGYYPNPSANGICIGYVIDALIEGGNEVYCLCNAQLGAPNEENHNNLHIRRVRPTAIKRWADLKNNSKNKIKKAFYSIVEKLVDWFSVFNSTLTFPVSSKAHVRRYFKIAKKIISEEHIDTVVGVNAPIDSLCAAFWIKKKFKNLKLVAYCLDPVYGGCNHKFLPERVVKRRTCRFEQKILEKCSIFISQLEHQENFISNHSHCMEKMRFVGVPLLVRRENQLACENNEQKVVLYAGALSQKTRNPAYIFEVFKHVKRIKLKMFVSNDERWVKDAAAGIENVEISGKVSHDLILKEMDKADAFLNIGNNQSMFCPSKIVEYIGYGKPIISLYRTDHDTCRRYMEKYPCGIYIDERSEDAKAVAKRIEEMLVQNVRLDYLEIEELFKDNTPQYTANLFLSDKK